MIPTFRNFSISSKRLSIKHIPSKEISNELCKILWNVRLLNVNLNPNVSHEKDFQDFQKYICDHSTTVATFWDPKQELQGFYGVNVRKSSFDGKLYQQVYIEYGYMNKEYRRRPEMNISILLIGLKILWTGIGRTIYAVGVAYPSSYIKIKSAVDVYTLHGEISRSHKEILNRFLAEHCSDSFDSQKKLVKMRTLPHPVPVNSPKMQQMFSEYESLNQLWRDGYGLPLVFDGNISNFFQYLIRKLFS